MELKKGASPIKVGSLEEFHEYFDFGQVYDILRDDSYVYQEFLKSTSFPKEMLSQFFGTNDAAGNRMTGGFALAYMEHPDLCLFDSRKIFQKADRDECVTIQTQTMLNVLDGIYCGIHYGKYGSPVGSYIPEAGSFQRRASAFLDEITDHGTRKFPYDAAVEIYIYLLLHSHAAVLPDNPVSAARLKKDLDKVLPISSTERVIEADGNMEPLTPFYQGKTSGGERLYIVRVNNCAEDSIEVSIKDTVLSRTVGAGETVYLLCKGDAYVSFLPRFTITDETVLKLEHGKLSTLYKNVTDYLDETHLTPACWAHSNEFGTFLVDETGQPDQEMAWPEFWPDQKIVSVAACGTDYCILTEDGNAYSRLKKQGWDHLISVSLGLNAGIAIDEDRIPILADGNKVSGFRAVAAYAEENHYICMDAHGQVYTDCGKLQVGTATAVAACERGYAVASNNMIRLYNFGGCEITNWQTGKVTELAASGNLIVYHDGTQNRLVCLHL